MIVAELRPLIYGSYEGHRLYYAQKGLLENHAICSVCGAVISLEEV